MGLEQIGLDLNDLAFVFVAEPKPYLWSLNFLELESKRRRGRNIESFDLRRDRAELPKHRPLIPAQMFPEEPQMGGGEST